MGEVQNRKPTRKGARQLWQLQRRDSERGWRLHGVKGDRMVGRQSEMNQGSGPEKEQRSWQEPEELAQEPTEPS